MRGMFFLSRTTPKSSTADWLTALIEQAQRPTIGAVGPLSCGADGSVRQAGLIIGTNDVIVSGHRAFPRDAFGYFSTLTLDQQFLRGFGTVHDVRRDAFLASAVSTSSSAWPTATSTFAYALRRAGMPTCSSRTSSFTNTAGRRREAVLKRYVPELQLMRRWRTHELEDPCYNSNLALEKGAYALRV